MYVIRMLHWGFDKVKKKKKKKFLMHIDENEHQRLLKYFYLSSRVSRWCSSFPQFYFFLTLISRIFTNAHTHRYICVYIYLNVYISIDIIHG